MSLFVAHLGRWYHSLPMIQHLGGECREILPSLPAKSIHACVTRPPYWALRSYLPDDDPAKAKEIGQERTVEEYIDNLIAVFRHVSRDLIDSRTVWLNLGDTHATGSPKHARRAGVKPGELIGVPWSVVLALQQDEWFLHRGIQGRHGVRAVRRQRHGGDGRE